MLELRRASKLYAGPGGPIRAVDAVSMTVGEFSSATGGIFSSVTGPRAVR
jgi:hypothetical protein